jgi:hypothetical protein
MSVGNAHLKARIYIVFNSAQQDPNPDSNRTGFINPESHPEVGFKSLGFGGTSTVFVFYSSFLKTVKISIFVQFFPKFKDKIKSLTMNFVCLPK